ncbi:MAG: nucleotidyl transferase AbiEii/AbiGii toxin family protein [Bacteroidales bacterium]|nr:nucleotidyl transferase AbiEii/AbiGii toxin family protein [Bacteroidales bacterium]
MKFIDIPADRQRQAINNVALKTELPPSSIEKDWWVTQVLKALHTLPYAEHIAFKGGTSLSKCWNLIARFSEDIDIALSQEFLGFGGELSKTQISDKLRRAACSFVRGKMQYDVKEALLAQGIRQDVFSVDVVITPVTTVDPEVITVTYQSLYDVSPYIKNTVKLEISGRSMVDPVEKKYINAAIDAHFPNAPFAEEPFEVNAVIPERTFLEKVFLLHEEFHKDVVRVERMSRHVYDLAMMMDSERKIADRAVNNEELYRTVLEHRRKFIGLKGFNYDELYTDTLCIVPDNEIAERWQEDYKFMGEHMIYGPVPSFEELVEKMTLLNDKIRQLHYLK